MGKIFISYANEDRALASDINERLLQSGHDVFFDENNLKPSDAYDQVILTRLSKSDIMLFLCSRHSLAAGRYTLTELEMAKSVWKKPQGRVLPVMLGNTDFDDLPSYLKGLSAYRQKGDPVAEITQMANQLLAQRRRKKITLWGGAFVTAMVLIAAAYFYGTATSIDGSTSQDMLAQSDPLTNPPVPPAAPVKREINRDIPILEISDGMLAYPKDYDQAQFDVPETWSFCPGAPLNILNTSSQPIMLSMGIWQSGAIDQLGQLDAGDFLETTAPEDQQGAFLITDSRTKNVFYFVTLNPADCRK